MWEASADSVDYSISRFDQRCTGIYIRLYSIHTEALGLRMYGIQPELNPCGLRVYGIEPEVNPCGLRVYGIHPEVNPRTPLIVKNFVTSYIENNQLYSNNNPLDKIVVTMRG